MTCNERTIKKRKKQEEIGGRREGGKVRDNDRKERLKQKGDEADEREKRKKKG